MGRSAGFVALQAEAASASPGERFAGLWVTCWRSRLPVVQLDGGSHGRVARTRAPAAGEDIADLVRQSTLFLTADAALLDVAAESNTPTVFLAGRSAPGAQPHARCEVVTSPTWFRRDTLLRDVHAAIERQVPGLLEGERSESSKCRERLAPWLQGRIADLGHGGHKIAAHAVGVDYFRHDERDWVGDVRDLWFFDDGRFDAVYSSHCLEDLWHPHQALAEWTRVLKPGGNLVLYLPLRDFYPNVGTPGANPGHKDDYGPEDIERFVGELGNLRVVHAARCESEISFEVVAQKTSPRCMVSMASAPPRVSVLVLGDCSASPVDDARQLTATTELAHASLAGVPHEILVLSRTLMSDDARALVSDLGARLPNCDVVEDLAAWPLAYRVGRLVRRARGDLLVLLQAGSLPHSTAIAELVRALERGARAARARCVDVDGQVLGDPLDAGACLALRREHWPEGLADATPYRTHLLFAALANELEAAVVDRAVVVTAGRAGLAIPGRGMAQMTFDQGLLDARVPVAGAAPRRVLVTMLRTLGDCVLATPILSALHERWPDAAISVLTETRYAWIFAGHPAVAEVLTTDLADDDLFWREDLAIATGVRAHAFDRLILLSDRLDHVSYHHSGRSLQRTYFAQAGFDRTVDVPGEVFLSPQLIAERDAALRDLGFAAGHYAVLHLRAGWPGKSLPLELAAAIATHLHTKHHLPVLVIGGDGEPGLPPTVLETAGKLTLPESAAFIAGARVFVGPDSGPLHIASAMSVPSLGLYAGSAIRVAPPTAHGSCAVQSPSSCALPCGVSPCAERACGFGGLLAADALRHLDRILDGSTAGDGDYSGNAPASYAIARDGLHMVVASSDEEPVYAAGWPQGPDAFAAGRACTRSQVTPTRRVEIDAAPAALLAHARAVLGDGSSPTLGDIPQGSVPAMGMRDLASLPLPSRVAAAFTLTSLAASRRLPVAELRYAGDALDLLCRAQRGDGERARPAAREPVDEALRRYLRVAATLDPSGMTLLAAIHRSQQALRTPPPDEFVLAATLASRDVTATARNLDAHLHAIAGRAAELSHAARLGLARLLGLLEATAAAEDLLARELAMFDPRVDAVAHGETLLARSLLRARDPRLLHAAFADACGALDLLQGKAAEKTALDLCQTLERHVRRALAPTEAAAVS